MDLSVVLPTLHRLDTARLLAHRIRELCGGTVNCEVILVTPRVADSSHVDTIRCIADTGVGVYAAYERGLCEARGEYVWFMGDDDFPLDFSNTLKRLIEERRADLIVAPVIYSTGRLYRPTRHPIGLLFYNWCQQGVLYRRRILIQHHFPRRFPIQADQYVNNLLRSDLDLEIAFLDDPICVFGAAGISSRGGDSRFRTIRTRLARRVLVRRHYLIYRMIVLVADSIKFCKGLFR